MAIAEVGSGSQRATASVSNFNSTTLAFPGNVTANSLLIVSGAIWDAGAGYTVAVSDTRSTSYSVFLSSADNNFGGDFKKFVAYGIVPSGGACTVTVNPSTASGSYGSFSIDEFSGVDTSSPLDVDGGQSSGTGTTGSDSLTTGTANALIIGVSGYSTGDTTIAPGGSYTQIGEHEPNDTASQNSVFRIATSATGYTVDWTYGASSTWRAYTAAFKEAGGAATGLVHRALMLGVGI